MADTDKVKQALSQVERLQQVLKVLANNPLAVLVVAFGGGGIGQGTGLEVFGHPIQWWWVALAVTGLWLVNLGTWVLRTLDAIRDRLDEGAREFAKIRVELAALSKWQERHVERDHRPRTQVTPTRKA